jgi:hypothetical protein
MTSQNPIFRGAFLSLPGLPPTPIGPANSWGTFTRYLAIGDDQFAVREVDLFENGYGLVYDREQWSDEFGGLADARFDENWLKLWGEPDRIEQADFEHAWQMAIASPARLLQIKSAKQTANLPWPVPIAWQLRHKSGG